MSWSSNPVAERLPHLAGTEPRVKELLDQGRDVLASQVEHSQDGLPEAELLDPLGGPLGLDLRSGYPPDLLGVGAKERVVEPPPESPHDPFLEGLGAKVAKPAAPVEEDHAQRADSTSPSPLTTSSARSG